MMLLASLFPCIGFALPLSVNWGVITFDPVINVTGNGGREEPEQAPCRRMPAARPELPTVIADGESLMFSHTKAMCLSYVVRDSDGMELLSGDLSLVANEESCVDVSALPSGDYELLLHVGNGDYVGVLSID